MVGEVTERIAVARATALPDDLRARIASGVVLGAVAIAANWGGAASFALLVTGFALVMAWEWGRIVRGDGLDFGTAIHGVTVAIASALADSGSYWLALVALAAGVAVVFVCCARREPLLSATGVAYLGLPAITLIWLRADESAGMLAILFVYTIVWTTDTFAYVCGKAIGGPKLWPDLSPGKTWAGTLGGIAFAALASLFFAWSISHPSPANLVVTGTVLSAAAQGGDLAESAIKRMFSVKHASHLIPGHGGFMDRMDGIVAAALVSALLALVFNLQAPARALLFWS